MSQLKKATLQTIGGGAIPELFQRELDVVMANIMDPNTPAKASRRITLTVTIKPNQNREEGGVEIKCASTLPGVRTVESSVFFGKEGAKAIALAHDPKQADLFVTPEKPVAVPAPVAVGGVPC